MSAIGSVSLRGIHQEAFQFTFLLASGITTADVGKAVALDSTANTVKLAGADEQIIGRLEAVEDRSVEGILVGTVATKGVLTLPIASGLSAGDVVGVGSTVEGNGNGEVKAIGATPNHSINYVVEVSGTDAIVVLT